ncbi:hypothetical protein EDD30_6323 [Couchioplanes caeruleus]|uniref:Uncharacterized protein n=3 Tax=Couchioplanes caeruleus TaxID=56438 RepID=A0A1K0FL65_9ACTN|nr:hypothetical protein BG844_15070 [Couchioplanes caeruleus subsp. caeruleus]ROP33351.1 hypothetical protein EDD30_6323 [Couchioplanes caeruleus]
MQQLSTSARGLATVGAHTPDADLCEVLARAAAIVAAHTVRDGLCAGCRDWWARLAPFPCEQVRWARAIRDRYGDACATGRESGGAA